MTATIFTDIPLQLSFNHKHLDIGVGQFSTLYLIGNYRIFVPFQGLDFLLPYSWYCIN